MKAKVQRLIDGNAVLVMATSTCPFCNEAKRTLAAHGVTGRFVDMDQEPNYPEMRKAMTALAGNRTSVPQIWIGKKHIGGCDDLKALESSGDLSLRLKALPRSTGAQDIEAGLEKPSGGAWLDAAVAAYPGPKAAYFSMFHSQTSMDNRAVRVGGVVVFIIATMCAVFAGRYATEWVVFGLFVHFCLTTLGLPSPLAILASLPFAGTKPQLSAGPSRQFANLCGAFFAGVAWVCFVGDEPIGAIIMLVVLAIAAFLQGFVNFCAGCFVFGYLMKFGLVREAIYRMHVNTRADTIYAWEKHNVRTGHNVPPDARTYPTGNLPSNPTDLRAKPTKEDDKWEQFHLIKYCHASYFMVPLSLLGLAKCWVLLSETVGTPRWVFQALSWTGVCLQVVLGTLFLAKCALYPSKVKKQWCNPAKRNSLALPFLCFILMSFLATKWYGEPSSGDIAKVLFWMGTIPLAGMTVFTIGSWVAFPCDEEYINPSWMILPVGNLMGAVACRPVSEDYIEWGWFLFGIGALLWLALWPITFRSSISNHHSDVHLRSLYGVWVAPPAVMMMAYANLEATTSLDPIQRLLFYSSVSIALVLASCTWPFNFFLEGNFTMSVWAFAFPLNALTMAAIKVHSYTRTDTFKAIYVVLLAVACLVNAANLMATLASLKARHLFTPEGKWSPLSFMKLTHEAFREAIPKLQKLAKSAKPEAVDSSTLVELASVWRLLAIAYDVHSHHEEDVIFPALEALFPSTTRRVSEEHKTYKKLMESVQLALDVLLGDAGDGESAVDRASVLAGLKKGLSTFGKGMLEHLDREEMYFADPVARKYISVKAAKDLTRKSWESTDDKEMSQYLGWVMRSLRIRGQRTRFLRTWVWAMPERAQQLGLMVYRVVDDVTWVEVARDLPEVIPRGLPGYRRYF